MTDVAVSELRLERPDFRLGPITLEFPSGSRTALVGPSGAGKTTLLRCLAGLETPSGGEVRFGGRAVSSAAKSLPPERRGIGFVFQRGALWPHMTALQHLRFVAPELDRAAALALLARVGLDQACARRRPNALSGGEAQRLALARALAPSPPVLLLDEPLASVDAHLRADLSLLIRDLAEHGGLTLVAVTHDRDEALAMADRLAVLTGGRLAEAGAALDLLQRPTTAAAAAFLHRATCFPAEPVSPASLRTPFGDVSRPTGDGPWSLVLLPGDLEAGSGTDVTARVVRCEPDGSAWRLHAVLGGRAVEVAADEPVPAGREVPLTLRGEPRILPETTAVSP